MDDGLNNSSRRRRGGGIVTPNACTECRKKRSKCDGQTPCNRCTVVKAECVYEVPVRQSKETMRAEIELLQNHRRQSERVLNAVSHGYKVQETINRLRNGDTLAAIADWLDQAAILAPGNSQHITTFSTDGSSRTFNNTLRMAESVGGYMGFGGSDASDDVSGGQAWRTWPNSESPYRQTTPAFNSVNEDVMSWSSDIHAHQRSLETSPTTAHPLVGLWSQRPITAEDVNSSRRLGQRQILGPEYRENLSRSGSPSVKWTNVTQDIHFVEHLLALYFCWEYPTFASLSKEHFLADFRDGNRKNCSSLLINAMLALGCRFSDFPQSREDPTDPSTSGDHFFAEAQRLLAEDNRCALTTIQAIGLMSIREASCGRVTESFYYAGQTIRLAVEAGLHQEVDRQDSDTKPDGKAGVRAATFWGAFALDQAWSLNVGRIPHFSRAPRLVAKPSIVDEVESSEWVPYTDEGVSDTKAANQPSNVRSVYKCFCELAELVHDSLYTLYAPGRRLTSNDILTVYTRFLNWYSCLPEALRLGHNFTPAVLFAHMYYHFAILLLFRPFLQIRFNNSRVSPRDVCSQAADAIITLVRSYDQLYTLKRTPSFVPYIVLASSTVHLIRAPSSASALNSFRQGINDLKDMCVCHGFAKQALSTLQVLAEQWEIGSALLELKLPIEEARNLCSPSSKSLNFFCPVVPTHTIRDRESSRTSTLFTPFPMQGLPLLEDGDELEQDGFTRD